MLSIKSRRFHRFLKLQLRWGSYQAVALSTFSLISESRKGRFAMQMALLITAVKMPEEFPG